MLGKVGSLDDMIEEIVGDDAEPKECHKEDDVDHFVCCAEEIGCEEEVVDATIKSGCQWWGIATTQEYQDNPIYCAI